ncbi:RDD family protein [Nocardia sp. NPDC050697]|uniref:RDD family protein n=1 Tax=Nocardia sp. NPDC050697 TaxID=3155158 RepID=UPI0033E6A445
MTHEPAPFFRRLAARILDLAFCLLLTFAVAIPVGLVVVPVAVVAGEASEDVVLGLGAWLCYFLAYVGLEVFLLMRRDGQTLGKGLLGLRVVPAGEWARPRLAPGPATARMLIIFLPFVFMSLAGSYPESELLDGIALAGVFASLVSLVLAMLPGRRRALHDLASGSRVVRAPRRKIELKKDLLMTLPGRVDLSKRP